MASGSRWNLWVWLAGGGCGCKEVYRFPHTTYPYSSCICSFLQQRDTFCSLFSFFIYINTDMVMPSTSLVLLHLQLPYSGFLSREKTFANCLKIDFRGKNFRKFAVTQCTTPTSAVSNCLKIDFRGENVRELPQKREIREKVFSRERNPLYSMYSWYYLPDNGIDIPRSSLSDLQCPCSGASLQLEVSKVGHDDRVVGLWL